MHVVEGVGYLHICAKGNPQFRRGKNCHKFVGKGGGALSAKKKEARREDIYTKLKRERIFPEACVF